MTKLWCILILMFFGGSEAIKITTIDGYPLHWLREQQPGTPPADSLAKPTPVPLRPLSMRTIYRTTHPWFNPTSNDRVLVIEGNALQATVRVKLIDPLASDCTAPSWTGPTGLPHEFSTSTTGLPETIDRRTQIRTQFSLPLQYLNVRGGGFTQNIELPHEFQWPWICVCASSDADAGTNCPIDGTSGNWIHTNMRYAPNFRCDGDDGNSDNTASFHGLDANNNAISNTNAYWDLCTYQNGMNTETVLTLDGISRRVAHCSNGECDYPAQPPVVYQIPVGTSTNAVATENSVGQNWGETNLGNHLWRERMQRTKCCGWGTSAQNKRHYGICINPFLEKCCQNGNTGSGKPYSHFREKCCYGGSWIEDSEGEDNGLTIVSQVAQEQIIISYLDDFCPCNSNEVNKYCNAVVPTLGVSNQCCIKTKYDELNPDTTTWGSCYDGYKMKCCDTGDIYDPGTYQCCKINGVQSLNVPCPCGEDDHCNVNQTCCQDLKKRMIFPTPSENNTLCNKYVNYPSGTGVYQVQPCLGQCIDSRFQICCNGMACQEAFENCCNNTCCNKFVQRCTVGLRPGALGRWNNPKDFRIPYEVCTTIEALTPIRAVLMYVIPSVLLFATFISLAFTLFFAKRQNSLQPLSAYEKSMFILACGVILFAWPLYFSAMWKYALVAVWVALFTILAALSQIRSLNIVAIVVNALLLVYLIDPFFGSEIFTLAMDRTPPRMTSVHAYSGVLSSILTHYDNEQQDCISFYDYFKRDPSTEDRLRFDNPQKNTFGFCSRDWFTALGLFSCILLMLAFLLFFATLITHIRNILFGKAEKTEEVVGWY